MTPYSKKEIKEEKENLSLSATAKRRRFRFVFGDSMSVGDRSRMIDSSGVVRDRPIINLLHEYLKRRLHVRAFQRRRFDVVHLVCLRERLRLV